MFYGLFDYTPLEMECVELQARGNTGVETEVVAVATNNQLIADYREWLAANRIPEILLR